MAFVLYASTRWGLGFVCLRASIPGDANGICWYYLASKHQKGPIPSLLLVKKFASVLQYHPKFVMVL